MQLQKGKVTLSKGSIIVIKGLRPYVFSHSTDSEWKQAGRNVSYEKTRLKYNFLAEEDDDEDIASM